MNSLRFVNRMLLAAIIVTNGYVISAPLWPQVQQQVGQWQGQPQKLAQQLAAPPPVLMPNSLIIPAMQFQGDIHDGADTYAQLAKGAWRWPGGSTPDKAGNTVILAHRFTYTNPRGAFYFLDKLRPGDTIGLYWQNRRYTYRVQSSRSVAPSDISILAATSQPTLTLYTCTPLWNPHDRLVVTARLETK